MTRPSRENLVSALYDHPNLEAVAAHFGESIALVQSWCDVERLRVPKPVKRRLVKNVSPVNHDTFSEERIAGAFAGRRFEDAPRALHECLHDHRRVLW